MGDRVLLWFRQDLRLADNPALLAASQSGADIIPVFILDDDSAASWRPGSASRVWLHHSLITLKKSLSDHLHCFSGKADKIIPELCKELGISKVFWNRCYEPWQIERDSKLKTVLSEDGVEVCSSNGSLLWEPWEVLKKDRSPYKVFTPFFNKGCLANLSPRALLLSAVRNELKFLKYDFSEFTHQSVYIEELNLLPEKDWHKSLISHWDVGEAAATKKLDLFIKDKLDSYKEERDFPARESCSRMSPHLHFGEISPHQIWHALQQADVALDQESVQKFQSEIAWREFSYYLLYHFPKVTDEEFNPKFCRFPWRDRSDDLKRWQRGITGYPLVDAGMRELWQTGFMHNRVRMVVASFLTKNLMIDWREGQRWFWDCLVDADLASNSASWQWVAGSGADAAPYFRIFNPVTQSEKFDPEGIYIRKYCPELARLDNKFIHKPWLASYTVLKKAGITLGKSYPRPMMDLKVSRGQALEAYKRLKNVS